MTFDLLEALEKKIEKAIDSITELQIKLDDAVSEKNNALEANEKLKAENEALAGNHQQWQSRLSNLVEKMDQVDEALETEVAEKTEAPQQEEQNNDEHHEEHHHEEHHHEEHHHEHHHNY